MKTFALTVYQQFLTALSLASLFVLIYNNNIYIFDLVRIRFFVVRLDYVRKQLYSNSTPLRVRSKKSRECRFLHVYNFKFYCGLFFSVLAHHKC